MGTIDRLQEAIATGEILGIVYHGGSQPGAFREIAPIAIKDGKVQARCNASNAVKTFVIEKIEFRAASPSPDDIANSWREGFLRAAKFGNLSEVSAALSTQLQELGWIVGLDSDEFGESLNLRGTFMNGKLIKTPDASLVYRDHV